MKESMNFITKNIPKNSNVILGVSGGPDSMCLLDLFIKLREEYGYNIIVAHINHNLRDESEEEYEFVKKYAEANNAAFEGIKLGKFDTNSIENEAREKRYNFFEELLSKYNSEYLCLAHHGDDLVETILMRLTRGSTLEGYAGFNKISLRNNYKIIRPLVFYTKDEILEYLEKNNIEYRVDKSNYSKKYTRNRYRLDILPVLKKEDKNIHKKYLKFSEELNECNDFIRKEIIIRYYNIVKDNKIDLEKLAKEDMFIVKKILNRYLLNIYDKDINLVGSNHIDKIIDLINSPKPNAFISLPNNIFMEKSYKKLYIREDAIQEDYKYELVDDVRINDFVIEVVKKTKETDNFVCHLRKKDIKLPLYVRNRREGDYIETLHLNGRKKIKDLFIDKKIELKDRDLYPLVVDSDDNIVWVPGLKKSKYDRLKTENYDIILKCTRRK